MLASALLLASLAAAQPQTAPVSGQTNSGQRRRSGGRGSGSGAGQSEGPDLDAAARRVLPCPKGFVAEQTGGAHLSVTDKEKKKAKKARASKKGAVDDGEEPAPKKRTLSRRCVPASSSKSAPADDEPRRSASEVLRE